MTKQRGMSIPTAALVLILATPVASWGLIGDLTNEEARQLAAEGVELDYAIRPVSLGPVGDRIVGVLACIGVIGALALLVRDTYTCRLDSRWWRVLLPLVGAGVVVGFTWRVLTAGGIGANIGAGLIIIFGGPLLAVLLIAAAVAALHLHLTRARRNGSNSD
ncbi:hypothetical protein FXF50_23955 [Micromonospora sp. AP08]|uniref:hypothetical protein n=1 Tax=Micromonospora sp. AP08 TaxID=2604467 RepID=UPI0011D986BB|nr:hypothetical protein [Micromonospora sp. AP08]TYB35484.1 hypothetical protein FXF50_23955 [Micromonospora sp. AP08]